MGHTPHIYGEVIDILKISNVDNSRSYRHVIDIIDIFIFNPLFSFLSQPLYMGVLHDLTPIYGLFPKFGIR